jgi:hypothetical protein
MHVCIRDNVSTFHEWGVTKDGWGEHLAVINNNFYIAFAYE